PSHCDGIRDAPRATHMTGIHSALDVGPSRSRSRSRTNNQTMAIAITAAPGPMPFPVRACSRTSVERSRMQQTPMEELERQHPVDLGRVVPDAAEMIPHHGFQPLPVKVGPRERARIQQHLSNVFGEGALVPDSKVKRLVPATEEALEAHR